MHGEEEVATATQVLAFWFLVPGSRGLLSVTSLLIEDVQSAAIGLGQMVILIIAREFARETQLGSLELALEPTYLAGNCAYGFSCAYNNTIAWRS